MEVYLYTLVSVVLVSLVSFAGAVMLFLKSEKLEKITMFLVAISAGALLGDAFLHLLPEAMKNQQSLLPWFLLMGGMLVFFILEKVVCWRHCHIPISEDHPHPLGAMNLVGDGLHNFIDGCVLAAAFITNIPLGIATAVAIFIHEVPQEIGEFGVLIHAGYTRKSALIWNFLSACLAVFGAVLILFLGARGFSITDYLIPFTAGGFIYIATADLIPELHKETLPHKSLAQFFSILFGFLFLFAMKFWLE